MYKNNVLQSCEERKRIYAIFDSGVCANPIEEIVSILRLISPKAPIETVLRLHRDVSALFHGNISGFKANNNRYHDLRHTYAVVVATVRLMHGCAVEGTSWSSSALLHSVISAYFHDTGLLLRSIEKASSGAVFTSQHEKRSVEIIDDYLKLYPVAGVNRADYTNIIYATSMELDFNGLAFSTNELRGVAQVVASADILAQMADRYYIEQLPHLYQERRTGGLISHTSPFELMKDTARFYHDVIEQRLDVTFGGISDSMRSHFRERWQLDRDLYRENIQANIDYLKLIVARCENAPQTVFNYLQRRPPR